MLHGVLLDPHFEFFIEHKDKNYYLYDGNKNATNTTVVNNQQKFLWNGEFVINSSKLPSFISISIADKILFIGKAVKLLQELQHFKFKDENSFLTVEEAFKFTNQLHVISETRPFHIISFENLIIDLRSTVGSYFWNLLLHNFHLLNHLQVCLFFFFY